MSITHHPSETSLLAYAGGMTRPAVTLIIATHLGFCPECASTVGMLEAVGGILLDDETEAPLSDGLLASTLAAIDRTPMPATGAEIRYLPGGVPCPAPVRPYIRGSWLWIAPGMRRMRLLPRRSPGGSLDLYRISPGAGLPEHGHRGREFTCVLSGSFSDKLGHFAPGDFAETDDTIDHSPIADQGADCVCLVASEAPLRTRTLVSTLMQPILRF